MGNVAERGKVGGVWGGKGIIAGLSATDPGIWGDHGVADGGALPLTGRERVREADGIEAVDGGRRCAERAGGEKGAGQVACLPDDQRIRTDRGNHVYVLLWNATGRRNRRDGADWGTDREHASLCAG